MTLGNAFELGYNRFMYVGNCEENCGCEEIIITCTGEDWSEEVLNSKVVSIEAVQNSLIFWISVERERFAELELKEVDSYGHFKLELFKQEVSNG